MSSTSCMSSRSCSERTRVTSSGVSGIGGQSLTILRDRGQHGFDGLLAKFPGAMLDTAVEQRPGIRAFGARVRALRDSLFEVLQGERHAHGSAPIAFSTYWTRESKS